MRIRPTVEITDRRSLKPEKGDTVVFEGVDYIVTQVGMRYVHMYRADDPKKFPSIAKIQFVAKKPRASNG